MTGGGMISLRRGTDKAAARYRLGTGTRCYTRLYQTRARRVWHKVKGEAIARVAGKVARAGPGADTLCSRVGTPGVLGGELPNQDRRTGGRVSGHARNGMRSRADPRCCGLSIAPGGSQVDYRTRAHVRMSYVCAVYVVITVWVYTRVRYSPSRYVPTCVCRWAVTIVSYGKRATIRRACDSST